MRAPRVTQRMLAMIADRLPVEPGREEVDPRLTALTPRELDVLRLGAQGLSNDEIAEQLTLSTTTVKTTPATSWPSSPSGTGCRR